MEKGKEGESWKREHLGMGRNQEVCDAARGRLAWDPNGDQKQLVWQQARDGRMRAKVGLPEAGVDKG